MLKRTNNRSLDLLAAGGTNVGRSRKNNEDFFIIEEIKPSRTSSAYLLCTVADGMGGQDYGEIASEEVAATFQKAIDELERTQNPGAWLQDIGRRANHAVKQKVKELNPANGMGSTVVGGLFTADRCYFYNAGDSRAYLFRAGRLERVTKDHSLVEILIDNGIIQPEEVYTHPRRGELAHYVGQPDDLILDVFEYQIQKDDIILICSDGLWEMVRDHDIAYLLANNRNPAMAVEALIRMANQNGGADNITAIVVRIAATGEP